MVRVNWKALALDRSYAEQYLPVIDEPDTQMGEKFVSGTRRIDLTSYQYDLANVENVGRAVGELSTRLSAHGRHEEKR